MNYEETVKLIFKNRNRYYVYILLDDIDKIIKNELFEFPK